MLRGGPSRLSEPDLLTPEQIKAVRQSLKKVLVSHPFAGSKRTQDFLQLIVGHALEGEIEVTIGDLVLTLSKGHSIGFDSSIPHKFRNLGTVDFHGIWFVHGCAGLKK